MHGAGMLGQELKESSPLGVARRHVLNFVLPVSGCLWIAAPARGLGSK